MSAEAPEANPQMVREDGTYPVADLRRDMIFVSAVQTRVRGVNGANPQPDIDRNLAYFLECIDIAQKSGGPPSDLLVFHEFPITGFSEWTKKQHYDLSLTLDGPEMAAVAGKAKQYNCYIVFGGYFKDEENWPGHVLHQMILMGPEGIVANHWKQRNLRGMWPVEQYTTTIYDVYDRFIEMYGIDAVVPIAQTDIGNIAMSAVQFEPELFRCMAMKGAEIVCRVATGGFEYHDFRLTSYHNSVYTIATNNAVNSGERMPGFFDDANYGAPGNSAIFGPRGIEIENCGPYETKRTTMIPIAHFRAKHRIPDVHIDLYRPVLEQYRSRYDHSAHLQHIPADKIEATKQFKEQARWIHNWM